MAESISIDAFSFDPFEGGRGKLLACTTSSASTVIPGTQAQPSPPIRILVTNVGSVVAYMRMGQSGVVATTDCLAILPGVTVSFTVPPVAPTSLYVAGITEAGSTKLQITAGRGI